MNKTVAAWLGSLFSTIILFMAGCFLIIDNCTSQRDFVSGFIEMMLGVFIIGATPCLWIWLNE